MQEFMHDDLRPESGRLCEQVSAERDPTGRRATPPFALHRPHVQFLHLDANTGSPGIHLGFEQVLGDDVFQRHPCLRYGHAHDVALRSIRKIFWASSTTPSAPALISAL